MTATTAPRTSHIRWKAMLAPLATFFFACFLFAGVLKFNLRGGDLWVAKPMGAPVTCSFLAVAGLLAGRWFFGGRMGNLPKVLLATLVVLLPVMGLLGVVHLATHDPISAAQHPTPLGGALGSMLAGPRAFGALGTTVAGITFALLAVFGGYLARRITAVETARSDDPYAFARTMSVQRKAAPGREAAAETGGGVAVAESEVATERHVRGDLFPHDVELEPLSGSDALPIDEVDETLEVPMALVLAEPPRRKPILAGLFTESEAVEEAPAPFLAAELLVEPEIEEVVATIPLDEVAAAIPLDESIEMDVEEEQDEDEPSVEVVRLAPEEEEVSEARPLPDREPEEEPAQRELQPRAPSIENDEPAMTEMEDDEEPLDDESELSLGGGGEAPELTPEWLRAPTQFHNPRFVPNEIATNEALFDILDVEGAPEVEEASQPAPAIEAEPVAEVTPEPVAEPEPARFRPRFRIKADYVRDEPPAEAPAIEEPVISEEPVEVAEAMQPFLPAGLVVEASEHFEIAEPVVEASEPFQPAELVVEAAAEAEPKAEVEEEAPRRRRARRMRNLDLEAQIEIPVEEPAPQPEVAAEPESEPPPAPKVEQEEVRAETPAEEAAPAEVEAQLSLPSMPEAAPVEETDKDGRPRRRSRPKDWASWDEPSPRSRPRLRLVKDGETDAPAPAPAPEADEAPAAPAPKKSADPYTRAVALVIAEDRCSVSLLQRNLGVTFGEATALIDRMYQQGVVGPYQPTGRRDVLKKGAAAEER